MESSKSSSDGDDLDLQYRGGQLGENYGDNTISSSSATATATTSTTSTTKISTSISTSTIAAAASSSSSASISRGRMLNVRNKVNVHVEVQIKPSCPKSREYVALVASNYLKTLPVFTSSVVALPQDLELNQYVERVFVSDCLSGQSVSFWQANLIVHAFILSEQEPDKDYIEGEERYLYILYFYTCVYAVSG